MNSPARRRWYQFSVSTLLVAVTAVALLVAALIMTVVAPARRQRDAVACLLELQAQVQYDYQQPGSPRNQPAGPEWLRKLIGDDYFQRVSSVVLADGTVRDAATIDAVLAHVERLSTIERLCIFSADGLCDEHLRCIACLRSLKTVQLSGGGITDAGVSHLGALDRLTGLELHGAFTDAGLAHLTHLDSLETLVLIGAFTDAGLEHLTGLTRLRILFLDGQITEAGLATLGRLTQLRSLGLNGAITDAGMAHLEPLAQLADLHCNACRVNEALQWPMIVDYADCPLSDALDFLTTRNSITYRFDDQELGVRGAKVSDIPITDSFDAVALADVLTRILAPHGLGYRIETKELVITTQQQAQQAHAGIDRLRGKLPMLRLVKVGW